MIRKGNWILTKDGWVRDPNSHVKGNASYFQQTPPPVRDAATGHPIGPDGRIDWAAVLREINKRDGHA